MSRSEGVWGEALVADYLREKGYKLAAHSYRCRFGEIDLIAWDKSVLCFVEVKTRTNTQMGLPREYVTAGKQARIRKPRSFTSATMALTAPPALMWPRSTPPRPGMKKRPYRVCRGCLSVTEIGKKTEKTGGTACLRCCKKGIFL